MNWGLMWALLSEDRYPWVSNNTMIPFRLQCPIGPLLGQTDPYQPGSQEGNK